MKYIRTKDGKIYDITKCKSENYPFNPDDEIFWEFESVTIYENEVSKEADTIGELCDEFVCENSLIDSSPRKENGQIIDRYSKLDNAIMLAKKDLIVYGSIWIDGSLIKVAKMNEKGELELL